MQVLRMADLDLAGKRVLIREDLNVPVQDGVVTSDARIRAALPTIQHGAREGRAGDPAVAPRAARKKACSSRSSRWRRWRRGCRSCWAGRCRWSRDWLDGVDCAPGEVVLCENVRFNKGEKKDNEELARKMAALCDVFVMDAFGTAHRAEASTHGVAQVCAGRLRRPAAGRPSSMRSSARCASRRGRWWRSSPARRSRPS